MYVRRNQRDVHFFFSNDLIQLYCLRHVSNNQVFIIKKSVQAALRYFIMHKSSLVAYSMCLILRCVI